MFKIQPMNILRSKINTQTNSHRRRSVAHGRRYDWVAEATLASDAVAAKKPKKPTMTKTAMMLAEKSRQKMADAPPVEEWKMKAFTNVPAKIGPCG